MSDIQQQLDHLRRRVAKIDKKYAESPPPVYGRAESAPESYFIHEYMSGEVVETEHGKHFETERLFERHKLHGSMDIASLEALPPDLLGPISGDEITPAPPARWAFLDTETTGLAGGSGTYAFLIGVGRITEDGFRVRQFFMRDYGEESSLLDALTRHLREFDTLVTYNGKTYDVPLLETRYRMSRLKGPFTRLGHLDLLYGARRIWKLRYESCRLVELERQIFGVEREGDIPGEMIPYVYFEYLRRHEAARLVPIFHHNAIDILSLACLTGIVPYAFRSPTDTPLTHGAELVGLARWLVKAESHDQALALLRRAVETEIPDELLFRTLWDIASIEKKLHRPDAALAIFADLSNCHNPYRAQALVELAKHYEHREKNYVMALDMTRTAIGLEDTADLRHREARLQRRLGAARNGRLL
ncbi:MAG: hypothetical protein GY953_58290 [bacterium]|nr:hypothetical protein [bacterium]